MNERNMNKPAVWHWMRQKSQQSRREHYAKANPMKCNV